MTLIADSFCGFPGLSGMHPPSSPMEADAFPQNYTGRTQAPVPKAFDAAEMPYRENSHKLQSNLTAGAEFQSRYVHPYHSHTQAAALLPTNLRAAE